MDVDPGLKRLQRQRDARPHLWAILSCFVLVGLCTPFDPIAGAFAGASLGSLLAHHARKQLLLAPTFLLLGLAFVPGASQSADFYVLIGESIIVAAMPRRWVSQVLRLPRWIWLIALVIATVGVCGTLLDLGVIPLVLAMFATTYLGACLSRHLAMTDARLLSWGDEALVTVTRDLLLGRVTSGMLHDLAQPLNVISMANGNMGYIVDHLAISDDERRHLVDRIERIATHTQGAASILSLFRWFGRDGTDQSGPLSVRSALDRAVAATRSNMRHHGVEVELHGDALDYPLPDRHGALEMMAVAALLCAFASFAGADGSKLQGKVLLHAALSPTRVVVSIQCIDTEGKPIRGKVMDDATSWLIEQVAREASGDFSAMARANQLERFIIRLGRDDI